MPNIDVARRSFSRREALQGLAATAFAIAVAPRQHLPGAAREPLDKQLIVLGESPYNAEPRLEALVQNPITPLQNFYVRNHGPVPALDAADFRLKIEGLVHRPQELSLAELQQRFPRHSAEATLTCAGNRRAEMGLIKPVGGVPWGAGAIGHAQWQGAILADVLRTAEIKADARHVWFEGLDPVREKDGSVAPFGGSIPLDKALAKEEDAAPALIADQMNGQPLRPEHGFPFRALIPGYIGARSVKWLGKIVVSDRPSPNHYLAEAYKLVTSASPAEIAAAEPIYENVVNGAICVPARDSQLMGDSVRVRGYALPSGRPGCTVEEVEISADGGRNWQQATREGQSKPFCWQLWHADVPVTPQTTELIVRVRDSQGHVQPENGSWNFKGYLYHPWHRVPVSRMR